MRTKQITILAIVFSLGTLTSSMAQDSRVIEVIASDTVALKPIEFIYQVSPYEVITRPVYGMNQRSPDTTNYATSAEIRDMLLKNKFNFAEIRLNWYSINPNSPNPAAFNVRLNSPDELNRLFGLIKGLAGVTGNIKEVKYEPMELYKAGIYIRLYQKAFFDASSIAQSAGRSVGQVISVEEIKGVLDFSAIGNQINELISRNAYSGAFGMNPTMEKTVVKRLLYRFQMM